MSTILQCRQVDSKQSNNNDDFTTMLDKPIKLDPGDSINIKSCFIDTKSENSNDITIDEDLEIFIHFGYYITYHTSALNGAFETRLDYPNSGPAPIPEILNGKKYILYKTFPKPNLTLFHYRHMDIVVELKNEFGDIGTVDFEYIDEEGNNIKSLNNTIVRGLIPTQPGNPLYGDVEMNIIARENTLKYTFHFLPNLNSYSDLEFDKDFLIVLEFNWRGISQN